MCTQRACAGDPGKGTCSYGGKLLCVPYYTGARAVIYRTDYYKGAGIKGTPKTLDQFVGDGKKLMKKYGKDQNFSAFYFPGKNWYASMAFVPTIRAWSARESVAMPFISSSTTMRPELFWCPSIAQTPHRAGPQT